jgi:hypothetical protein
MYETLVILKISEKFSPDEMFQLVQDTCANDKTEVAQYGNSITITSGNGEININFNNADFVLEESIIIAKRFSLPCADSSMRFEVYGTDPDGDLIHSYYQVVRNLQATNKFIIFDQTEQKLLFAN